jgi:beta-galactosidase
VKFSKGRDGYVPGTVTVRGLINGKEVCQYNEGYEKLFTVRAKDLEGIPVFRKSAMVVFSVTGPAELVGVDNGDLCSCEPYENNGMYRFLRVVQAVSDAGNGEVYLFGKHAPQSSFGR